MAGTLFFVLCNPAFPGPCVKEFAAKKKFQGEFPVRQTQKNPDGLPGFSPMECCDQLKVLPSAARFASNGAGFHASP